MFYFVSLYERCVFFDFLWCENDTDRTGVRLFCCSLLEADCTMQLDFPQAFVSSF